MKFMEDDGTLVSPRNRNKKIVPNVTTYNLTRVQSLPNSRKIRPTSPRVKPPAHFARVVASIMSCKRPQSPPAVYADYLARKVFQKSPFHDDQGLQLYIDSKFGSNGAQTYIHTDLPLPLTGVIPGLPKAYTKDRPKQNLHGEQIKDPWLPNDGRVSQKNVKDSNGNYFGTQEALYEIHSKSVGHWIGNHEKIRNDARKTDYEKSKVDLSSLARIQSKNVLHEDLTGGLNEYSSFAENVDKFKQIFRDEARAKGLLRPTTAEVTNRMIERTAKKAKKKLGDIFMEKEWRRYDRMRQMNKKMPIKKQLNTKTEVTKNIEVHTDKNRRKTEVTTKNIEILTDKNRRKTDVTTKNIEVHTDKNRRKTEVPSRKTEVHTDRNRLLEILKQKTRKTSSSEESEIDEAGDMIRHPRISPNNLHPGIYDDTAKRFHGVMSGPFTLHVNTQSNRISFSLAKTPPSEPIIRKSIKPKSLINEKKLSLKKRDSSIEILEEEENDFEVYGEDDEDYNFKLSNATAREKSSPNPITDMKEGPVTLPFKNLNAAGTVLPLLPEKKLRSQNLHGGQKGNYWVPTYGKAYLKKSKNDKFFGAQEKFYGGHLKSIGHWGDNDARKTGYGEKLNYFNGQPVLCKGVGLIRSKNVLHEDLTGGLSDYSSISDNVDKFKQIFRDEARAKGLLRPTTADVRSRMIERTAKKAKKKMDDIARKRDFRCFDPMRGRRIETIQQMFIKQMSTKPTSIKQMSTKPMSIKQMSIKNGSIKKQSAAEAETEVEVKNKSIHKERVPLAQRLIEILGAKSGSSSDESQLDASGDMTHLKRITPKKLRPGVYDDTAEHFHGIMSGPFIPHLNNQHRNRISFSLAKTPPNNNRIPGPIKPRSNRKKLQKRKTAVNSSEEKELYFEFNGEDDENYTSKFPNLAVREKVKEIPVKLPSLKTQDKQDYEDKLLFPKNAKQPTNFKGRSKRNPHPLDKRALSVKHTATKLLPKISHLRQKDQVNVSDVSHRWGIKNAVFKSPLKTPTIPLLENLMIHFEKKFPRFQWPRGVPVGQRYYPSGQPFCVAFENGAGRVHYPHGGIAVVISAPEPYFNRVLVIRDPFEQVYSFDKAALADINCDGTGVVYDHNGIKKLQYNLEGGYLKEGLDKPSQRWQWKKGGQRFTIKLNRYMGLRILDLNKIYLVFYGNKRGFRLNVGAGRRVCLMSVACDDSNNSVFLNQGPVITTGDRFDYVRGRLSSPAPVLGFFDNQKASNRNNENGRCQTESNYFSPDEARYTYSFSKCNIDDVRDCRINNNCFSTPRC